MPPRQPIASRLPGLPSGYVALLLAFAAALTPPPVVGVHEWACEERYVAAESGSPFPGKWDPNLAPYTHEIEDCLSFTDPARDVTVQKAAQMGLSEIGLNVIGSVAVRNPSPIMVVLPTTDEITEYNKTKLQNAIDATPTLKDAILEQKSRDEDSSTARHKKFKGGFLTLTGANSSAGLQSRSVRVIIFEEPSSYPAEAGERGDPIDQAISRQDAWDKRGPKRFFSGTPAIAGSCRITQREKAGDQRRYYVACPHCTDYQILVWGQVRWTAELAPHRPYLVCRSCAREIQERHLPAMLLGGQWIKTYPGTADNPAPPEILPAADMAIWKARDSGGRQPSFKLWQIYSPFTSWETIVGAWFKAQGDPKALKTFTQQRLGEAYEERGDAPPSEKLLQVRQVFPWKQVPAGALFLTGAADVQGDRIEWDVYAWSVALRQGWRIDGGVIIGSPEGEAVWRELDRVIDGVYHDADGRPWEIDGFGIDSGYLSSQVYRYVWRRVATEARTRIVYALDGRDGWGRPPLAPPRAIKVTNERGEKIGAVNLWAVGTFDLKSEIAACLREAIIGRDEAGLWRNPVLLFDEHCDRAFFDQLTAEYLGDRPHRDGTVDRIWMLTKGRRNERLDTAVYARAIAHHLADPMSAQQWHDLAARRLSAPARAQLDLAHLWAPPLATTSATAAVPTPAADPSALTPVAAPVAAGGGRRLITSPYLNS